MPQQPSRPVDCRLRLREVLLGYLWAAGCPSWPGADGLVVEDVLRTYPRAAAAGLVPDREELLRRHADLADALRELFAEWGRPDR
jgi:hypothetical protein